MTQIPDDFENDYDDDDEEEYNPYYFYDNEDNFAKLRLAEKNGSLHQKLKLDLFVFLYGEYHAENLAVYPRINFYETLDPNEVPLFPDVALVRHPPDTDLDTYQIGITGPAPCLIIEVISEGTYYTDIEIKPQRYAKWGTAEYFAYYNVHENLGIGPSRLWGWRLNKQNQYDPIETDVNGRMWSEQLACWLGPDDDCLRLYDEKDQRRLNKVEFETQRADEAEARLKKYRAQTEAAHQEYLHYAERTSVALAQIEQYQAHAEVERLSQMLRDLGHDPDQILKS